VFSSNPKYVLIVDDDLADTYLLQKTLLKCGCQTVNSVATGEEAAKYISGSFPFAHRRLPNVIFLDLKMRGMDGFDLLNWLKTYPLYRGISVVIFSGSNDPSDKEKSLALGAVAYYQKTQEADKLKAIVEDVFKLPNPSPIQPPLPNDSANGTSSSTDVLRHPL
jgi:CheY-like chemotaxis protein